MIRAATADDLPLVQELWRAFDREVPDEPWREDDSGDLSWLGGLIADEVVLLAEEGDEVAGVAVAKRQGERIGFLELVYVRPESRRRGVAAALVRAAAARLREAGAEVLELDVLASNAAARAAYERWGLRPVELRLAAPLEELERRLAPAEGPTFGSVHVQTDDASAVERAVQKVLPRLGRSAGTRVSGPANGWVAVHDELCDRDPAALRRLAKELSYSPPGVTVAIGIERGAVVRYNLFDRGGAVDEYLSVPEFYGPLPPGDAIALGSNPTVVARLTGADPRRVRETARTASSPAELPPAQELLEQIAEVMGLTEAGHGWEGSR
ncbi:MAG TPA: GNAT family N-acetyltransferase [Gaiellaceae bacterium]|nr:GNAT family N-acetyltransferase [Gaiellaceae bacterium]